MTVPYRWPLFAFAIFLSITASAQNRIASMFTNDSLLHRLLIGPAFDSVVHNPQYRIQIIYTQIDRGANGIARLTHHFLNNALEQYFYPASTVKLPIAVLALQRLNELAIDGLDRNSTMITDAASPSQTAVYNDPSAKDGRPTIGHYIKKIFLVSDNDAFNRLYEFLGQEYINGSLHRMGYTNAQLLHRLQTALSEDQNRRTNPVKFFSPGGKLLYTQPEGTSAMVYAPRTDLLGNGYLRGDSLVREPFDFSKKNRLSLEDLHRAVQSIALPETIPAAQRFNLTEDDHRFLLRWMSSLPSESAYPSYDSTHPDAYVKFLLFGGKGDISNKNIRIFNKVGDAYGFLTDAAYVLDFDNGIEFMLSATIYCNSDGIFNDDKYDYDTIGFPFLKALGEAIYRHELSRKKQHQSDLSKFRFNYHSAAD